MPGLEPRNFRLLVVSPLFQRSEDFLGDSLAPRETCRGERTLLPPNAQRGDRDIRQFKCRAGRWAVPLFYRDAFARRIVFQRKRKIHIRAKHKTKLHIRILLSRVTP